MKHHVSIEQKADKNALEVNQCIFSLSRLMQLTREILGISVKSKANYIYFH